MTSTPSVPVPDPHAVELVDIQPARDNNHKNTDSPVTDMLRADILPTLQPFHEHLSLRGQDCRGHSHGNRKDQVPTDTPTTDGNNSVPAQPYANTDRPVSTNTGRTVPTAQSTAVATSTSEPSSHLIYPHVLLLVFQRLRSMRQEINSNNRHPQPLHPPLPALVIELITLIGSDPLCTVSFQRVHHQFFILQHVLRHR